MVTFHEIKRIIQKMAVLSSYIGQLGQLLPAVIQLTEQIGSINDDLTLERDKITAKMRSVEVLGEILKAQVYQNSGGLPLNGSSELLGDTQTDPIEPRLPSTEGSGQSTDSEEITSRQDQGGYFPGINSGSLMI